MREDRDSGLSERITDKLPDSREVLYQLAFQLANEMKLEAAIELFEKLGDYKNSRDFLNEVKMVKGVENDINARLFEQAEWMDSEKARAKEKRRTALLLGAVAVVIIALAVAIVFMAR